MTIDAELNQQRRKRMYWICNLILFAGLALALTLCFLNYIWPVTV